MNLEKELPMDKMIFSATRSGFASLAHDGAEWRENARGLEGKDVTSLIAREGVILAGTTDGTRPEKTGL